MPFLKGNAMIIKDYAIPRRVDFTPSPLEPDDDGVLDVGYRLGKLSDGRSYRLECWRMDDMLMVTIMFADTALSTYKRADMLLLVEAEGLIEFNGTKKSLQAAMTEDDAGNKVWALNIMLANHKGTYGQVVGELRRYR